MVTISIRSLLLLSLVFTLGACAELTNPSSGGGGYPPGNYSGGYRDPYGGYYDDRDYYRHQREAERARQERREVERERDRLEEERERLEEERRRAREAARHRNPPPPKQVDRCPSGFSPSDRKCEQHERKRGCKDMRTPSGMLCVHR